MRVYYNLRNDSEAIVDKVGVEVTDLGVARSEAEAAIEEIRAGGARDWTGWRLAATDEAGELLFSLVLGTHH